MPNSPINVICTECKSNPDVVGEEITRMNELRRWVNTLGTTPVEIPQRPAQRKVEASPVMAAPYGTQAGGPKYDGGKPRWYMLMQLCAKALAGVMGVLEFGAKKYAPGSWSTVEDAERRYKDAIYRHLHQIELGQLTDDESGLLHYDHIATNAMFLSQLAHNKQAEPGGQLPLGL